MPTGRRLVVELYFPLLATLFEPRRGDVDRSSAKEASITEHDKCLFNQAIETSCRLNGLGEPAPEIVCIIRRSVIV